MHRWWRNNVARHFWYHFFNWRFPNLPRIKPGKMTPEMEKWAREQADKLKS